MIGNLYNIAIGPQSLSAARTLIELAAPSNAISILERAYIGESSQDSQEQLAMKIQGVTTTGTGTTTTPGKFMKSAPAAGGTQKTNMTAEPTYTSGEVHFHQAFSVLSGVMYTPASDEEIIVISPSGLLGIMQTVTPSAAMDFHYGCTFRQIGG